MKADEYNPKAREAFGKSLVDIGVAIFKSLMLLFTVIPISLLLKSSLDNTDVEISVLTPFENMSIATYFTLLVFLALAFTLGHLLRSAGLKHIHESEEIIKNNSLTLPRQPRQRIFSQT